MNAFQKTGEKMTNYRWINPVTGLYEERNEYLSGNVREKLEQAEQANENGQFDANIRALVKIIPMDIPEAPASPRRAISRISAARTGFTISSTTTRRRRF